ncbi:hypothetical protein NFI96_029882 [Prochilodus magdalenae]|nr:hypothetical protein NFI96_029882 [Prochilodus magdalenae]
MSLSEDDSNGAGQNRRESHGQSRRVWKYECPADFVSHKYNSSASSDLHSNDHTELWLIKAPARFDADNLAGLKVSLSGLEMVQSTCGRTPQIYSVLASSTSPADIHLLTSSCTNEDVSLSASAFTGVLNISESYGDCNGNQDPIAIPAAPAPSIPPGLRQRFQPFGSSTPAYTVKNIASTSLSPSKRAKLCPAVGEEQEKKKKKKRKEKHYREEEIKEVHIKQEQISYDCSELQTPEPVQEEEMVERRKKKKVKKESRDRQEEFAVDSSVIAKQEPMDISYEDIDTPVKKKKKKKKTLDQ